ncbi:hypothetical protein BGZ49_008798 [Haplosporangium sp. Z 27]|nr:hypothetical protein BGZ49_008798 [Haplosporangium sp. Z 27]
MPHIQELTLFYRRFDPKYIASIALLKRLRKLRLGPDSCRRCICDFRMFLNLVQQCPSLETLDINGLGEEASYPSPHGALQIHEEVSKQRTPSRPSTVIERFVQRLTKTEPDPNKPSKALKAKEPWRKFVPQNTIHKMLKHPDEWLLRQLDPSEPFSKLTILRVKHIWSSALTHSPIGILFRKSPFIRELYLDVGSLKDEYICDCLEAITDSCHQIQTLGIESLSSNVNTSSSIQRFFKQHRPNLEYLELKECINLDYALDLIPSATAANLQRIRFDSSISSHPCFHRFMTRCSSLQYLTWVCEIKNPRPLPLQERLDAFLEPWPFYETMRHVEQRNSVADRTSLGAFINRLALMQRLASLSLSVDDIRRMIEHLSKEDRQGQDITVNTVQEKKDNISDDSLEDLVQSQNKFCSNEEEKDGGKDVVNNIKDEMPFGKIQEIMVAQIQIVPGTQLQLSKQIDLKEIRQILEMFPKLRKIRYHGNIYPLDQSAREYLKNSERKHIDIFHSTQSSPTIN